MERPEALAWMDPPPKFDMRRYAFGSSNQMNDSVYRLALAVAAICAATAGRCQAPFDVDPGFVCTIYKTNVASVLPLSDGSILVSGNMRFSGQSSDCRITKLDSYGTQETTFHTSSLGGGKLTNWNGLFYVGTDQSIRRILPSGFLDSTFIPLNNGPYFSSLQAGDYHIYPDGRVLLGGVHTLQDSIRGYIGLYSLIWFTNTGYLDTTQHHRTCNGSIDKIHPLPDGRFLLSGVFSTYEGQPVGRIIRVEADGALDTTFHTDIVWGQAFDFEVLPDQRVLASGLFQYSGNTDTLHVIRLLPNGTPDPWFTPLNSCSQAGDGRFVPVSNMYRLSPDTIIINGGFDHIDGAEQAGIAAIDSNGFRRTNFLNIPGCGSWTDTFLGRTYNSIRDMVPDGNGGYYIFGSYHGYDDGTTNYPLQLMITRLYGLNVGVREVEKPMALQVVPNPSSGPFTLELDLPEAAPITDDLLLQVFDMQGRQVMARGLGRDRYQRINVDLTDEPAGLYSAHLSDGKRILTGVRLVVE